MKKIMSSIAALILCATSLFGQVAPTVAQLPLENFNPNTGEFEFGWGIFTHKPFDHAKRLLQLDYPSSTNWFNMTSCLAGNYGPIKAVPSEYVFVGPGNTPGVDCILQNTLLLTNGATRVKFTSLWLVENIISGALAHQKAGISACFKQGEQVLGDMLDIVKADGSTDWEETIIEADVPDGADTLIVRIYTYGCQSGKLKIYNFSVDDISTP